MAYAIREIGPFRKKYLKSRCNEDVSPYMRKKISKSQNLLRLNQDLHKQPAQLVSENISLGDHYNNDLVAPDNDPHIRNDVLSDDLDPDQIEMRRNVQTFNYEVSHVGNEAKIPFTLPGMDFTEYASTYNDYYYLPEDLLSDLSNGAYATSANYRPQTVEELLQSPDISEKISTPAKASPEELLWMVLKYSLISKLPTVAITRLLSLINTIFEKPVLPFCSKYMIDKFLNDNSDCQFHGTCPNCGYYVGRIEDLEADYECQKCHTLSNISKNPSSDDLIIVKDPRKQIVELLETHEEYYDNIVSGNLNERKNISDIFDGMLYRNFVESLPLEERHSYATVSINQDGADPFEKSPRALNPLYISINELPIQVRFNSIIPVLLWFNRKKPNMTIFLKLFVDLINEINNEPLECTIKGEKRSIKLHVLTSSVDSVARGPMQGITQFNGKWGCGWCLHPTEWVINATKYPINPKKGPIPPNFRTHEDTVKIMRSLNMHRKKHLGIKALSPLIFLPDFDIIKGFTVDYMHCILLGVAKQVTNLLIRPADIPYYQNLLDKLKLPHQVCRLTRLLSDNKYWKAREWENWVLYLSLPLFAIKLSESKLQYWSLLVESLHILLKSEMTTEEINAADAMLKQFVKKTQEFFGKKAMSYNVHLLLHVADSVKNWGPLWANSTFAYESANHKLLQAIHCANGTILQILRYINLSNSVSLLEKKLFYDESEIVKAFCKITLTTRVKKFVKVSDRTYFGKGTEVEKNIISRLNLSENSRYFLRLVFGGCLYSSCLKENPKTDNSVVLLRDGNYIRIEKFIVDSSHQKDFVKCRLLKLASDSNFYNSSQIKQIIEEERIGPLNPDSQYYPTNLIKSVCVSFVVDGTRIVCCVPNLYYY